MKIFRVGILFYIITTMQLMADGCFVTPFVWNKEKDINETTQKAIIVHDAGYEDLILQVKYDGPVEEFGWLIPVPSLPKVEKGTMDCFYESSKFTQELWERTNEWDQIARLSSGPYHLTPATVIEVKTVGDYELTVLSSQNAQSLQSWLAANRFVFPSNKLEVLDSYVKRGWYFIAARINLAKTDGFKITPPGATPTQAASIQKKLASGELHPLKMSFATDKCVFPLKISSANGTSSEVEVYVLSKEPLVEKTMFEKQLPDIYKAEVLRSNLATERLKHARDRDTNTPVFVSRIDFNTPEFWQVWETLKAQPEELLPYRRVTLIDLPELARAIPRFAEGQWWLTKRMWKLSPEEMDDLWFEPALPVLADELGTPYGYYAATTIETLGRDAIPVLLEAFQSTNAVARINAMKVVYDYSHGIMHDGRLTDAVIKLLRDPEPRVRVSAVGYIHELNGTSASREAFSKEHPDSIKALFSLLQDPDFRVRNEAMRGFWAVVGDLKPYVPEFEKMLKDPDVNIREMGFKMLYRTQADIPPDALSQFLTSSDHNVPMIAMMQMRKSGVSLSDEEVGSLLTNAASSTRLMGLNLLYRNPKPESVALALPLLDDKDVMVRDRAARTLRALTGQKFTGEQTNEWRMWWASKKTNFVIDLHPEELRPSLPVIQRQQ